MTYKSETSGFKHYVLPYIKGNGLDLGSGGDPVIPTAIQVDLQNQYTPDLGSGRYPVQLRGDAARLYWFKDNSLDYVYSSHLLEDFGDWLPVLTEWCRVIKPGGHLILLVPDGVNYQATCKRNGTQPNGAHKHEASVGELTEAINQLGGFTVLRDELLPMFEGNDYNIMFVAQKVAL